MDERQIVKLFSVLLQIEQNTRGVDILDKPIEDDSKDATHINILRTVFFEKLDAKTGWGRNELKNLFDDCISLVKEYPF